MKVRVLPVIVCLLALSACGGPVRDQKVDGPYRVWAADDPEDRTLSYDMGGGSLMGRVEATVVGVGHDERYITVERRPFEGPRITEYYYVVRALDGPSSPPEAVKGPFAEAAFEAETARLHLPEIKPVP